MEKLAITGMLLSITLMLFSIAMIGFGITQKLGEIATHLKKIAKK